MQLVLHQWNWFRIDKTNFELYDYPPCSPNSAPSDYYLTFNNEYSQYDSIQRQKMSFEAVCECEWCSVVLVIYWTVGTYNKILCNKFLCKKVLCKSLLQIREMFNFILCEETSFQVNPFSWNKTVAWENPI